MVHDLDLVAMFSETDPIIKIRSCRESEPIPYTSKAIYNMSKTMVVRQSLLNSWWARKPHGH